MERPNPQEAMQNLAQDQWRPIFQSDKVFLVKAMNRREENMKIISEPRSNRAEAKAAFNLAAAVARRTDDGDGRDGAATPRQGLRARLPRTLYVREFVHINFPVRMRLAGECPAIVAQTEAWLPLWARKGEIWKA